MKSIWIVAGLATALISAQSRAQQVERGDRPVLEIAGALKSGEFVWAPELSPSGPALLVVNLATQRAVLFRNGTPIAASSISSGKPGHETPTGVFSILEKRKEHYSSTYNNAPMPNMQRLTWKGIALHAGKLPGYPASHGCIRLPTNFSSLLFSATVLGMTVVITSIPSVPTGSAAPSIAVVRTTDSDLPLSSAAYEWHPERSPEGMVSVVVSVADGRAVVLRGGVEIGSAPVRVAGGHEAVAYVLRSWDESGQQWLKLRFAGSGEGMEAAPGEGKRFQTPAKFRYDLATILRPGSVIIVTPETLSTGSTGSPAMVLEEDRR